MKTVLNISAILAALVGVIAVLSLRSDIQVTLAVCGFGFAVVFAGLAAVLRAVEQTRAR